MKTEIALNEYGLPSRDAVFAIVLDETIRRVKEAIVRKVADECPTFSKFHHPDKYHIRVEFPDIIHEEAQCWITHDLEKSGWVVKIYPFEQGITLIELSFK